MGIEPVMGLSSYDSITKIQPMNYAIENEAEVSDVYSSESTKQTAGINATNPIQYPNATTYEADPIKKQDESLEASQEFNAVASKFAGAITGYNASSKGTGYGVVGSTIDVYA